ncbi:T9SS type A sorting domain-containing protein [Flammeovirga pacifica]|uniref:Secretion system C-terminal sorting domain-containing protein n=1 Tax=Flammeovirga pacifica TaxID=915059 RepID=A0A1S1YTR2_FLAPC|nr:T9SS type A sorting domain-containing protein [Flammeovirga pacifica]OHX64424.1 hypothetical protein NH26_22815 [Flammeovirga pacifica]
MKLSKITILLVLFTSFSLCAQQLPSNKTFFNPTFGGTNRSISPSSGTGDDTSLFNSTINAVTSKGGIINVKAGTYRILGVKMKSNVHLRFAAGVTLLPFNASNGVKDPMFEIDGGQTPLKNFSIMGSGGRFKVDLRSVQKTKNIRVFFVKNATNFKVSGINITDNQTVFSSFAFFGNYNTTGKGAEQRITKVHGVPHHGIIENISVTNAAYGYGLVQVQVGHNLLFRNLNSTGGVALRLETGYNPLQFTKGEIFNQIKLREIWGRSIHCKNGQAAVTLSPHTLKQGRVDIKKMTAVSCETGFVWAAGYVSSSVNRPGQSNAGLTPGSFSSNSKIRDLQVTFGQNAQLHYSKRLRYIPCQLRKARVNNVGIAVNLEADGGSRKGPSICSVYSQKDAKGHYALDFPVGTVKAIGFKINEYGLAKNAIVSTSKDDYEVCNESIPNLNFWVPKDYRNTVNPRNPLESSSSSRTSIDMDRAIENTDVNFYPNPTNGQLTIDLSKEDSSSSVQLYNMLGQVVYQARLSAAKHQLQLEGIEKGMYILRVGDHPTEKIIFE